ncbi:hypothetical protein TDB9533_03784 [Thalassocella blandensis]|nr:hypothetical protein TDB9533_03784 [Thalassocella blandensis]
MSFKDDGFEILDGLISLNEIEVIKSELSGLECLGGGLRNAEKRLPSVAKLVESKFFVDLASEYLPAKARIVRSILFIKSIENNWFVAWHQDKTVAVSVKMDKPGWGPWSTKDGVLHVQPPIAVLEQMITFRIHLDDSTEDNGCLKVVPNSHRGGIMPQDKIQDYTKIHRAVSCVAPAGSVLVMRPHILHSSSKAISHQPRRVLHVEYSSYQLPHGVKWA